MLIWKPELHLSSYPSVWPQEVVCTVYSSATQDIHQMKTIYTSFALTLVSWDGFYPPHTKTSMSYKKILSSGMR